MNKIINLIFCLIFFYAIVYFIHYENSEIEYSYEKIKNKVLNEKEIDSVIPKNIIQSFSSRYVTEEMKQNIDNWINLNEEYSYTYFDENEIVEFIKKYYSKEHLITFYKINAGAGRADFFRYLYLYKFGGVWIDITLTCFVPLRNYIKNTTELAVVYDVDPDNIYNAFMGFPKNHPILKNCIEKCMKHVNEKTFEKKKKYCIYHTTGPELLKIEYDNYFKDKEKKEVVVLTKELILENNITQIIKEFDTYNCFYILLNEEKIMKTKFKNAKKNLEFVSKKLHYEKINFFNDNLNFINEIPNFNREQEIRKELTILIKSSLNYSKLENFYNSIKKQQLENFSIILVDDFSQNNKLLEIYKKLDKLNVDIKINPISRGNDIFIDSLNFLSSESNFILYLEEERQLEKNFLNKLLEKNKNKETLIDLSNHFDCFSLFFHSSIIEKLELNWIKNKNTKKEISSNQFILTLKEELTS